MLDSPGGIMGSDHGVIPLDLLNHVRAPALRPGLLEALSARFMRQIALALFKSTRSPMTLLSSKTTVEPHDIAIERLPDILLAGIADLTPLRGRALLAIDGALLGAVVDGMCGATMASQGPTQDLSVMETRIGRHLIDTVYKSAAESLAPLGITSLRASNFETAHAMLTLGDSQDWIIEVTGRLESNLGQGKITLLLPFETFDFLEQRMHGQAGGNANRRREDAWLAALTGCCEQMPLPVRFEIARGAMAMSAVSLLKPGSLLPLKLLPEAIAVSGGEDLFKAEYGQFEGNIACRVSHDQSLYKGTKMTVNVKDDAAGATKADATNKADAEIALEPLVHLPGQAAMPDGHKLLDRVQVAIAVELGRADLTVKDVRGLRQGQVIALDQRVGEPLVIYANGLKMAYGEVVAVGEGERYGIRVIRLASDIEPATETAA